MKFKVSITELLKGINRTIPAIPPKSTLPVLEHILIEIQKDNNKLSLTATDQDLVIRTTVEVIEANEGSALIPARKISEILKALGNKGDIEIEINMDNYDLIISTQVGKYVMKALSKEEYVDLPLLDEEKFNLEENFLAKFTLNEISRLANKSYFAVSNDEFRLAMTGVLFQFRESYVNAVSTDSFRLVRVTNFGTDNSYKNDIDIILPTNMIDILRKAESDTVVYLYKNSQNINTNIRFDFDNSIYISRLINEKFPPYQSVLPQSNEIVAIVDKTEILQAIKRVSIFANVVSKQIKFRFEGSSLILNADDEDSSSKANEQLFCNFNSDSFEIGFNYKYIEEAISNLETDETNEIYMTFSDPNKPALIKPNSTGDKLLMLVMPVRINA